MPAANLEARAMSNFTVHGVYEFIPLGGTLPTGVRVKGHFKCPDGADRGVLTELRITAPAAAVTGGTFTKLTSNGLLLETRAGEVVFELPVWNAEALCGTEVSFEVRGMCGGQPSAWEAFSATVEPRHDTDRLWIRKLDGDMHVPPDDHQPKKRWYPANLAELLWCAEHIPAKYGLSAQTKAVGSHWGISYTAVSPNFMIETATPVHEPGTDQTAGRLNRVLYDAVPECLTGEAWRFFLEQGVKTFNPKAPVNALHNYLFHVEAGIRIYELYSYADSDAERNIGESLAAKMAAPDRDYFGPWALETMGGAGGQTLMGVASTATHGGDVKFGPIGEVIVALHLIAPDGQEYWIERTQIRPNTIPMQLFDEQKLKDVYRPGDPKAPGGLHRKRPIIFRRDNNLIDAAIASCGRMGIVYSVVVRVMRQYALEQHTETSNWSEVRQWLCKPAHPKHVQVFNHRFVRIDVDAYPTPDLDWGDIALTFALSTLAGPIGLGAGLLLGMQGSEYRSWIITRNLVPLNDAIRTGPDGQDYFFGRKERGGDNAGKSSMLEEDADDAGSFTNPCDSEQFLRQLFTDLIGELSSVRNTAMLAWAAAGTAMALFPPNAVWARPAQALAERVILFCQSWIFMFSGLRELVPGGHFGDFLCAVLNVVSEMRAHALVQLLYQIGSDSEHREPGKVFKAISYAVMDEHNYRNKGCIGPGDSIEFFMDADNDELVGFIDSVLQAVRDLSDDGKGYSGFISMRFQTKSDAPLATQKWNRTVGIEMGGLSRANGTEPLLARLEAESLARGLILHWGQRNHRTQRDIEQHFPMQPWRDALSALSEHGRLANLSTDFTRVKGLEITVPKLYELSVTLVEGCAQEQTTVSYDAEKNPPETKLVLVHAFDSGVRQERALPDLKGKISLALGNGPSTLELRATRELNGHHYEATPTLKRRVRGIRSGDHWDFQFEAALRQVDGQARWYVEINLFSQSISNQLRVSEVTLTSNSAPDWTMRNAETGDIAFGGTNATRPLAARPVFNRNWRFFTQAPVAPGPAPTVRLRFTFDC
jgi:hypothetical protein